MRTRSDSDRLRLVSRSPDSWALHNSLSDVLERFLFGLVLISISKVVLEESRGGSCGRGSDGRSGGVIRFGVISLGGVGSMRLLFLVVGLVRVAGVAGHVRELSFVAVGVDVAVLAADYAVSASGFLLEGAVSRFVAEREAAIIIYLKIKTFQFINRA